MCLPEIFHRSCAMKTTYICLFVLVLMISGMAPAAAARPVPPVVGEYFPGIAGESPEGEYFNLAEHYNTGKYILVDFWAYWCRPCLGEIPGLVEVWNEYGGEKFLLLGVNMDTPATMEKYYEYVEEEGITFPIITEWGGWDTSWSRDIGIRYVPQNFLMAPDGRVIFRDLRGENVMKTIKPLMEFNGIYEPIMVTMDIQDDPRKGEDWVTSRNARADVMTAPFAPPWNIATEDISIRIKVDNPQAEHFDVTLHYELYRPTGKRTHRVKDKITGEIYKHYRTGKPYIVYEAEIEEHEVAIGGWDGKIDTGYKIPIGEDVWEVKWWITVHSPLLDIDTDEVWTGIDFAGYWTMTPEMMEEQGGIFFAEEEED